MCLYRCVFKFWNVMLVNLLQTLVLPQTEIIIRCAWYGENVCVCACEKIRNLWDFQFQSERAHSVYVILKLEPLSLISYSFYRPFSLKQTAATHTYALSTLLMFRQALLIIAKLIFWNFENVFRWFSPSIVFYGIHRIAYLELQIW